MMNLPITGNFVGFHSIRHVRAAVYAVNHKLLKFMDLAVPEGASIMAKAKTPRPPKATSNPVITMPEAGSVSLIRKASPASGSPADVEAKIRERAYQLYQERGSIPGHEKEDWLRAEHEIIARQSHQQTA